MTDWITPYVPEDGDLCAAVGEVALRHTHLDHMLKMTIKSLTGITVNEALSDTKRKGSKALRRRIKREAKERMGEGKSLDRLEDILDRCARISDRRNEVIHNVWAMHLSEPHLGQLTALNDDLVWENLPTLGELRQLIADINVMVNEMNDARLHGWLRDALERTAATDV